MKDLILKISLFASMIASLWFASLSSINNMDAKYVVPCLLFGAYVAFFSINNKGRWIFK